MNFLVVIPHYGPNSHLQKLLPTLGVEYSKFDVSEEENWIAFEHGDILIVNNNINNRGFTKSCNLGLGFAAWENSYDIVWLLNNDTEIEDLSQIVESVNREFGDHFDTGIIGSCIVTLDDPDFIHHGGTGPAFPAGVHKVGRRSLGQCSERTLERWVTGASVFVRRELIEMIGLMDENLVNYGSDSDYCFRARAAGFKVVYLPSVIVRHAVGQSANPSKVQERQIKADMLYFSMKWVNGKLFHDLENEVFDG